MVNGDSFSHRRHRDAAAGQHRDDHQGDLLRRRGAHRGDRRLPSTSTFRRRPTPGRGDLIATTPLPVVTKELTATICWFGEKSLEVGQRLRLKHTTKVTPVRVNAITGVVDIETLRIDESSSLVTNEIGLATLADVGLARGR
jgi:hypothetical protein